MLVVPVQLHTLSFYVAASLLTIDMNVKSGAEISIEEWNPEEVKRFHDRHWVAPGISIHNPVFDVTPSDLITALITERRAVSAVNKVGLTDVAPGTSQR